MPKALPVISSVRASWTETSATVALPMMTELAAPPTFSVTVWSTFTEKGSAKAAGASASDIARAARNFFVMAGLPMGIATDDRRQS